MIPAFQVALPGKIIFGDGAIRQLPHQIAVTANAPLLVVGGQSFQTSPHFQELTGSLRQPGISSRIVSISGEPSPQTIDQIVADCEKAEIDLVVAIGGGSVIDAGKALAAMLIEKKPVREFLEGIGTMPPTGRKLPFFAVPTTAGTGSEATANAVLSLAGKNGYKRSLRHTNYIPDLALVDPALTRSCPPALTASCGMDCFSQLVEAYLSTAASQLTDLLALDGIRAVARSLLTAYRDGANLTARTDLSYAATLSGIVLANAGLGAVHGFASVLGGCFPIPHGVVCGTLMAETNRLTLRELRAKMTGNSTRYLAKYAQLGKIFATSDKKPDAWYQDCFIETLDQLTAELQMPLLGQFQILAEDISSLAAQVGNKNNPVLLDHRQLTRILARRL